jgi:hypothetical protein
MIQVTLAMKVEASTAVLAGDHQYAHRSTAALQLLLPPQTQNVESET